MRKLMFLLLAAWASIAQAQNPLWVNAPHYLHPSTGQISLLPVVPSPQNDEYNPFDYYDGKPARYSSNSITDADGQLMYFIIDGMIYDKDGTYIEYAWSSAYPYLNYPGGGLDYEVLGKGGCETVVVPHPTDCNIYYLFTASVKSSSFGNPVSYNIGSSPIYAVFDAKCGQITRRGPWYSNFDIDNSSNAIDELFNSQTPTINGDLSMTGSAWGGQVTFSGVLGIASSDLQPDGTRFVVVRMREYLVAIRIDQNGNLGYWKRHLVPYISDLHNLQRCEMEMVQDPMSGKFKVAFTGYQDQNGYAITIMDLSSDLLTVLGTPVTILLPHTNINQRSPVHGLEFSPDRTKLYFTSVPNGVVPNAIHVVDLNNPIPTANPFLVPNHLQVRFGQIELATNGNLYFAGPDGLYELTNPNNPSPANFSASPVMFFTNVSNFGNEHAFDYDQETYTLPDQVDGMDYSAHLLQDLTCCLENRFYHTERYVVSGNETWSPTNFPFGTLIGNDIYIKENLTIKAGAKLTIEDLNVYFGPTARVIVENSPVSIQGGELNLTNTALRVDDRCSQEVNWLGVEVWGNANQSQGSPSNSTQGRLIMRGSRIEHASIGILLSKRKSKIVTGDCDENLEIVEPFTFDDDRNGGFVISKESYIFGCQRGVFFRPYLSSTNTGNLSVFTDDTFRWSGPLRGGGFPQAHAALQFVNGVRFIGCDFLNATPSTWPVGSQGTGIFGYESGFSVSPRCQAVIPVNGICPNPDKCRFEGLRFGIRTYNIQNALTFGVDRSIFDDCIYGVHVTGTQKERIIRNTFAIREGENYQTAGLAMYKSSNYTVTENTFYMNDSPLIANTDSEPYGIVVNNSGENTNLIYKNEFHDLDIGGQSEGVNATLTGNPNPRGLQWICNTFESVIELADMTVVNGRIRETQGDPAVNSANNAFSLSSESPTLEHDLMVSPNSQSFLYVYPAPPLYLPDSYTAGSVTPVQCSSCSSRCPSILKIKKDVGVNNGANRIGRIQELEEELAYSDATVRDGRPSERDRIAAELRQLKDEYALWLNETVFDLLTEGDLDALYQLLEAEEQTELLAEIRGGFERGIPSNISMPDSEVPEFLRIEAGNEVPALPKLAADPEAGLRVYPNPGDGRLTIELSGFGDTQIEVLDLRGQVLRRFQIGDQKFELDLSELGAGLYLLRASDGAHSISHKVVIR